MWPFKTKQKPESLLRKNTDFTNIPALIYYNNEVVTGNVREYAGGVYLVPKIIGWVEGFKDGTVSGGTYVKGWKRL